MRRDRIGHDRLVEYDQPHFVESVGFLVPRPGERRRKAIVACVLRPIHEAETLGKAIAVWMDDDDLRRESRSERRLNANHSRRGARRNANLEPIVDELSGHEGPFDFGTIFSKEQSGGGRTSRVVVMRAYLDCSYERFRMCSGGQVRLNVR